MNYLESVKPQQSKNKQKNEDDSFQYKNKIKSGLYAFVLFSILSQKVSYKILDLIVKVFSNKIEVVDENENPLFLGIIIMSSICGLTIFMF